MESSWARLKQTIMQKASPLDKVKTQEWSEYDSDPQIPLGACESLEVQVRGERQEHALEALVLHIQGWVGFALAEDRLFRKKQNDCWKAQLFCHQTCGSGEVQTGKLWSRSSGERFIPVLWVRSMAGTSPWPRGLPLSGSLKLWKLAIFHRSDDSLCQEQNHTYCFLFPQDLEPKFVVLSLNFQHQLGIRFS